MRFPPFLRIAAALLLIICSALMTGVAHAGQITCAANWWFTPAPYQAEVTQALWPSHGLPYPAFCQELYFQGEIVAGDYEKLETSVNANHPYLAKMYIASPGGDLVEAMKIGRLIRKYLIEVEAPTVLPSGGGGLLRAISDKPFVSAFPASYLCKAGPDCLCASACAIIWLASVERKGRIGIHRHHFSNHTAFGSLSSSDAFAVYAKRSAELKSFLLEMETTQYVVDKVFSTGSGEIVWFDHFDGQRSPSFAE